MHPCNGLPPFCIVGFGHARASLHCTERVVVLRLPPPFVQPLLNRALRPVRLLQPSKYLYFLLLANLIYLMAIIGRTIHFSMLDERSVRPSRGMQRGHGTESWPFGETSRLRTEVWCL